MFVVVVVIFSLFSIFLYSSWPCSMCSFVLILSVFFYSSTSPSLRGLTLRNGKFSTIKHTKRWSDRSETETKKREEQEWLYQIEMVNSFFYIRHSLRMTQRCQSEFSINWMKTKWYLAAFFAVFRSFSFLLFLSSFIGKLKRTIHILQQQKSRIQTRKHLFNLKFSSERRANTILKSPQFTFLCPLRNREFSQNG